MKDSHLTLRLPRELARALAKLARGRGVPKSALVREAVAGYLAPPLAQARSVTAAELAVLWARLPRLSADAAAALGADVEAARAALPPPPPPWT